MTTKTIEHDLAQVLRSRDNGTRLLLCRGEEERGLLWRWIKADETSASDGPAAEKSIHDMIQSCSQCGDVIDRKPPFGSGSNRVMIILNAPVLINRLEREVYRRDSIELLKKMIQAMRIDINETYITNLIKCEVRSSLLQPSEMVNNCSFILKREIERVRPGIIIVMGDLIPLQKIIKESINISWHNTEHPITLLKNPELKRKAWETMKVVMQKMKDL